MSPIDAPRIGYLTAIQAVAVGGFRPETVETHGRVLRHVSLDISVTVIICCTARHQSKAKRSLKELKLEDGESVVVIDARSDNKPTGSKA